MRPTDLYHGYIIIIYVIDHHLCASLFLIKKKNKKLAYCLVMGHCQAKGVLVFNRNPRRDLWPVVDEMSCLSLEVENYCRIMHV